MSSSEPSPAPHDQRVAADRWVDAHALVAAAIAVAVATATRLLYWFTMRERPLTSDAGMYHELATNLANGDGYTHTFPQLQLHPTAFRPPLYPYLLSGVYRVFGSYQGVGRAFAVIIGAAVVATTFVVVRRHASALTGFIAALAVALYPPLIANDTVTLTEGLSLLLLLLLMDAVLRRAGWWAGLWCGLLTLARPSAQFLVVVVAVWLLVKTDWRKAAAVTAATVMIVAPWVVRNAVEVGTPTIVTSNGFNLSALYSPEAQAAGGFVDPVYHPGFEDLRFDQFDEATWEQRLRQRALDNIRSDPSQVLGVVKLNAQAMFELKPSINEPAETLDGRNMTVRAWALPLTYLVIGAGMLGWWRSRRIELAPLAASVAAYFALASLIFVSPPRLRAPIDLMLCIGAALLVAAPRLRKAETPTVAPVSEAKSFDNQLVVEAP